MSTHPEIVRLTDELFEVIASFLKDSEDSGREKVRFIDLIHFLKDRNIDGLTFRNTYPYSYQVEYIVTNLVRKGRLKEEGDRLWLSLYGKNCLASQTSQQR